VEGWDTETEDGKALIMANSQEWRRMDSLEDCLGFIAGRSARGRRNFWWNMDYDVTAILKWDLEALKGLTEKGKYGRDGWTLSYLPKKVLKVKTKGEHTVYHYDAYQFYKSGLAKAAKRYLDRESPAIKAHRADLWSYDVHEIGVYCKWDATATRDLARLYIDQMHKMGLYPKHFISRGNLAQQFILTHGDVPTWRDNPRLVNLVAWDSLRGALIDLWKRGSYNVWKYDLKSAYPAALRELPDMRDGEWRRELYRDSRVGFVRARVKYRPETPPILATWGGKTLLYPYLDEPVRCWLTLDEWRFLERHADVEVEAALCFVEAENPRYPWRSLLDRLLAWKDASKGDPGFYVAVKEAINSFYGKTCEKTETDAGWRAGRLLNPVAASYTLGWTRVRMAEAAVRNLDSIVMLATDSLTSTKPLHLEGESRVGGWELEAEDRRGFFLQPGVYEVEGERVHSRGFRAKGRLTDECVKSVEGLVVRYNRPFTSREVVHWGRPEDANVFTEREYLVGVRNTRRIWEWTPPTYKELVGEKVESAPIPWALMPESQSSV